MSRVEKATAWQLVVQELTMETALETFLRLGCLELSEQTVHWYRDRLGVLVRELGGGRRVGTILEVDLLDWLAGLKERGAIYGGRSTRPEEKAGLSRSTLAGYVRACRRLFNWLHKRGYIEANPAKELPLLKPAKDPRKGISEEDAVAMLEAARGDRRDYAILWFLYSTGGRLGGAVHLQMEDLDLEHGRATVREKGAKSRAVFLEEPAVAALRLWLAERPDCGCAEVFVGRDVHRTGWQPLREGGLYAMVKRVAARAGVRGKCSPHQWRHGLARRLAKRGMPLGILSQIMGHSSVTVTVDFYGQFGEDGLHDAYRKYTQGTIP